MGADLLRISVEPRWARGYLAWERGTPNHPAKRTLLRLLLRLVAAARPRPFGWRMENGSLVAISPLEGLGFAWTVGWTCFQTGRWEPHVERCIRTLLRPGDTAVDVGANLGYFTISMARSVGTEGRVWAFEPVPPTFDRLRLSVSLNRLEQVTPLPLAVGDVDGEAQISFDPQLAGSASLHGDARLPRTEVRRVPICRLDGLVDAGKVAPPQLIKIDVEGHELAVIRGALATIAQTRPFIVFEFSEPLARAGGWTLADLAGLIRSCGDYRFFDITDAGLRPIAEIAAYRPEPGRYGADLLAASGPAPAGAIGGAGR